MPKLELFLKGAMCAFLLSFSCAFATTPPTKIHDHPKKHHVSHHHPVAHQHVAHHISHAAPLPRLASTNIPALVPYQHEVCSNAKAQIGTPYIWGGTAPGGFDCSGFSQYVYKENGFTIPRTAAEQFHSLAAVKELEPGDLVFFRTHGRGISHVGIYIGSGEFIHSPARGQDIRTDNLYSQYWKDHYAGARRVLTPKSITTALVSDDQEDDTGVDEMVYPAEAST
jgi:hypothetical protein